MEISFCYKYRCITFDCIVYAGILYFYTLKKKTFKFNILNDKLGASIEKKNI